MHCWKQQCLSFIDSKVNFDLGSFNYYMKFRILILKIAELDQKKVMRYVIVLLSSKEQRSFEF